MKRSEELGIGLSWSSEEHGPSKWTGKLGRFPWRVFSRYFLVQFFASSSLLWILVLFFQYYWQLALNFTVFSIGLFLFTSYVFSYPIYKIYLKTLRLSDKKNAAELETFEDLTEEQFGEFAELEHGLDRLQKKLKKRKDQLQREREEMQAFMSSVQEGLINVSLEEKVIFFNSQFATLFLDSEKMQMPFLSLTDIFRTPEIYASFKKVLETGQTQKVTMKMETKLESSQRNFLVSLAPLRKTKSNQVYGVIGVFHDITDIKKLEQVRIDFVANASHELRSPLTSVKGYVDTLKDDVKKGQMQQADAFLEIISRNVNRLIELVNDLLTLSSLESHSQLKIEKVNPMQISDMVVSDLAFLAKSKGQVIRIQSQASDFYADFNKVEQVLRNLVTNAIKYIPEGKQIQVIWENNDKMQTVLRVIDNGPGIPSEHHSRLFERFYRVDKGRSRDQGGTGLGLAIVKHIMISHGGSIHVKSELGLGSEFICTFPLREVGKKNDL